MADRLGPVRRALRARREPELADDVPQAAGAAPDVPSAVPDELLAVLSRRCEAVAARQQELLVRLGSGLDIADRAAVVEQLAHLGRQVRRTGADLRVLAGGQAPRDARPRPLDEVIAETANGARGGRRVVVRRAPPVAVTPEAAADVGHLLGDLLDAASAWAARDAAVVLAAVRSSRGGVLVSFEATGADVHPGQLRGVNAVLAGEDVPATRAVGLVVAARLAARHGIAVEAHGTERGAVLVVDVPPGCLVELPALVPVAEPVAAAEPIAGAEQVAVPVAQEPTAEERWAQLFGRQPAERPGRHAAGADPTSRWFAPGDDAAAPAWASVGDPGWLAAAAVQAAAPPEATAAGLPRRRRGARLLPGSVAPEPQRAPARDAETVRGRLRSFQRGVSRGRHALREPDPDP